MPNVFQTLNLPYYTYDRVYCTGLQRIPYQELSYLIHGPNSVDHQIQLHIYKGTTHVFYYTYEGTDPSAPVVEKRFHRHFPNNSESIVEAVSNLLQDIRLQTEPNSQKDFVLS